MSACEINQAAWNHEQDVELCTGPAVKRVKSQHLCHLVLLFRFRFFVCVALLPFAPCSKLFDSALRRKKTIVFPTSLLFDLLCNL